MNRRYRRALLVFRRDLRLGDNTALIRAAAAAETVVPVFVFDPRQIESNDYFSANAFEFMLESLDDLEEQIARRGGALTRMRGIADEVVERLIREESIDAVFVNLDYTPFSRERDERLEARCRAAGAEVIASHDALLHPPGDIVTAQGTPYSVFTPFHRAASRIGAPPPGKVGRIHFVSSPLRGAMTRAEIAALLPRRNSRLHVRGGRARGLEILKRIDRFADYASRRDDPADDGGTTSLSAYLKFGCLSAREASAAVASGLAPNHELIRQLHWRDFFTHVAWFHPRVFGQAYRTDLDAVEWDDDQSRFQRWCDGTTGFPIVDAGMRQLAETGWMHNRVRMIVASFLVKDLHIDWRWGERHFARTLVDYDPTVNNGNWQWAASTGADAQPWFRIFNPWLQQKKFDPRCEYIRRWVPELRAADPKRIHALGAVGGDSIPGYPRSIVDHAVERTITIRRYERARRQKTAVE